MTVGLHHSLRRSQVFCHKLTYKRHFFLLLTPFSRSGLFLDFFERHHPLPFQPKFSYSCGVPCGFIAFSLDLLPRTLSVPSFHLLVLKPFHTEDGSFSFPLLSECFFLSDCFLGVLIFCPKLSRLSCVFYMWAFGKASFPLLLRTRPPSFTFNSTFVGSS